LSDSGRVMAIASEQFVAAVAAQRHLDALSRLAREVMGRQGGGIAERLPEHAGERNQVLGSLRLHAELVGVGYKGTRDGAGVATLVVPRVIECDRKGADGPGGARAAGDDT